MKRKSKAFSPQSVYNLELLSSNYLPLSWFSAICNTLLKDAPSWWLFLPYNSAASHRPELPLELEL